DFRDADLGAEYNVLEVFDYFQIAESFEQDHIKQSIIENGLFKERERSAIKPSVADQNKRPSLHRSVIRFDEQSRRLPRRNLRCGDEIAQRPEASFEREAGFFYHLSVEADAGKLDEVLSICAR